MRSWFKKNKKYEERTLGSYVLGATLGMGGYARVKLGIHKETGDKVALKILFADKTGKISESKKRQVNRAIDLLSKINHKNVLRMLEYNKSGEYPEANGNKTKCITMALEHCGNGELFDYLMFTGFFEEIVARSYFHQLIDGLDAIHELGYAHRDLKPENLLLDDTWTLKIADFGFATAFRTEDNQELKMKTACGTRGYLAPEVLKGKKYQQSVDIFAAGIILFIIYGGFPPFNDAIPTDWWWNRLDNGWKERKLGKLLDKTKEWSKHGLFWAAHERTRKFPMDLKDFILKLLHPDPQERPTIEEIRSKDWDFYKKPDKLHGAKEDKNKIRKVDRHLTKQTLGWYKKEIKDSKFLGEYLEKRRNVVRKERNKKIKQQLKGISSNNIKQRALNDTNESELLKRIDPNNDYINYLDNFNDMTYASTPYYFFSSKKPIFIVHGFENVSKRLLGGKISFNPKDSNCAVNCEIDGLESQFEVRIYLYKENKYIISCKRLRGDPLAFKKVIDLFWESDDVVNLMDIEDE